MLVVHLMASPFYGGPERQMLGLARNLPEVESIFLSYAERGLAQPFIDEVRRAGFDGRLLTRNMPHFFACVREVEQEVRRLNADLMCCSGYKPDIIGWLAARRASIPVISVSHGWTGATWKVRLNEAIDRWVIRRMDAVVCVSKSQADRVRRAGVAESKIAVIQNAVGAEAFMEPNADVRAEMAGWFSQPPRWLIGAAGRISPEKGFAVFVEAAAMVLHDRPDAGFVLFGDGPLRGEIQHIIAERGIRDRFVLAGFRSDVTRFLPNLDVNVMSSFTEGLPIILLEAGAAGLPTVATAVGGIPEVIDDGQSGFLVPPGDAHALAQRIVTLLDSDVQRQAMGAAARERVQRDFSFAMTSRQYHDLFKKVTACAPS
jgi:glycosyltransferase involved in cell wall biosynthesis